MTTYSLYEFIRPETPDLEVKVRLDQKTRKKFIKTMHRSKSIKRFDMMSSSEKRAKDIIHQIKRIKDFENFNVAWVRFESDDTLIMNELSDIIDLFGNFKKCTWWHKYNPQLTKEILYLSFVLMKV